MAQTLLFDGTWSVKSQMGDDAFANGKGAVAIPIATGCHFIR